MQAKKGFTLIELLVVITIIGVLATFSVATLNNAREKSRDSRRISDIKQIQTALEHYSNLEIDNDFISPIPQSFNVVNCDNLSNNNYNSTSGNTYTLKYCLEDRRDLVTKASQIIDFY